jgi:hypothetical protein
MANEKFKVKFGLAVGDTAATVDGTSGDIVTNGDIDVKGSNIQNSTGALILTSTGANNVQIFPGSGTTTNDGSLVLGQFNTNAILATNGTGNLDIRTGTFPNTANINLASGVNGSITLSPDGSGTVIVSSDLAVNGTTSADITTTTTTASVFNTTATTLNIGGAATTTNIGSKTGSSIINGTNRFTSPSTFGFLGGATTPSRGYMQSNGNAGSAATARNSIVMRTFPTGAGGSARGNLIFENSRGTETTPSAVQNNDLFAETVGTGYVTNGWITDYITAVPGQSYFFATENWANTGGPYPTAGTVTNAGTGYNITLQPTATNLTSTSRMNVLNINPQTFNTRSDSYSFAKGKTNSTQMASLADDGTGKTTFSVRKQDATSSSEYSLINFDTARSTGGTYSPTQNGDYLGQFKFNGNALSGGSPGGTTGPGVSIDAQATETWTTLAQGTSVIFTAIKTGTTTSSQVINASPNATTFKSDAYTFDNSSGTDLLTIDSSGNIAVTGDLTVTGNDIKSSSATALTLSGANVAVAGDLTVTGNDIKSSSATALTLSGADVAVAGDLTVTGNEIKSSSANTVLQFDDVNARVAGELTITGNKIRSSGGSAFPLGDIAIELSGTNVTSPGNIQGATILTVGPFDTSQTVTANVTLLDTNTASGGVFGVVTRYKASSGATNLTVPQNGYRLGGFKVNGFADTAGTDGTLAGQVSVKVTENWTTTANGTAIEFLANKQGEDWTTGHKVVISASPDTSIFASDIITLQNSLGTDYAVLDANTAKFNVPVTTELTTTTISEGTTYTPAATVDNNISVQINTLAGGTTVFDLASLTGNSRGASYNILVFNNTGSGAAIQVKNTRINSNNLMTHTITTGSPRIIINAYVIGDYATADHLVVA